MAELADAHGSGPCDSNIMRVQVPFSASIYLNIVRYFTLKDCTLCAIFFIKERREIC